MDLLFYLILFAGLVTLVIVVDRDRFETFFTPSIVLVGPFLGVVSICILISPILGFVDFNSKVLEVWFLLSLVFWSTGQGVRALSSTSTPRRIELVQREFSEQLEKLILIFGSALALLLLLHAYRILGSMGGPQALMTKEFTSTWGTGLAGHIRVLLMIFLIRLIGSVQRFGVQNSLSIVLMLAVLLLYQSKGAVIAPVLAGFLYRAISGKIDFRVRHIAYVVAGGFIIFNLAYLIGWSVVNPRLLLEADTYLFFASHFMSYLFSGILGFSESISQNEVWSADSGKVLFAPLWNLAAVVSDKAIFSVVEMVQENYVQIHEQGFSSNVNSMFGTIYLAAGFFKAILIVMAISVVAHLIHSFGLRTANPWILVAYCYWLSLLGFAWFEYYFWLLSSVEIPVICIAFAILERFFAKGSGGTSRLGRSNDTQQLEHQDGTT